MTPAPVPALTPANTTIGTGSDTLVLKISQDAYQGSAQYTVSIDGVRVGGTLTAVATRISGQEDTVTVKGNWGAGSHKVTVNFLNDAWGGTAATDRNLQVNGITFNGTPLADGDADLNRNGPVDFGFTKAATAPVAPAPAPALTPGSTTIGTGSDTLVLKISQDAYQGSAQYTVSVDGVRVGGTLTAVATRTSGQEDTVTVKGNWGAGSHKVTVNFLNDAWGGSAATDRNLQVNSITFNGTPLADGDADLNRNGPVDFGFAKAATAPAAAAPVVTPAPAPEAPATPAAPEQFGTPGVWGRAGDVWFGNADFGGLSYKTYGGKPDWGDLSTAQISPTTWSATDATRIAVDNFVTANLDLRAAGSRSVDVMAVSAKNGAITLGGGNDKVTWVAHSEAAGADNTMVIRTGAGNDTVVITAAGISPLADYDRYDNGSLYQPNYDGARSTAVVYTEGGNDTVTTAGKVALVLNAGSGFVTATGGGGNDVFNAGSGGGIFTGGAGRDTFVFGNGDGDVVIRDFTAGTDKLQFLGLTAADVTATSASRDGVSGVLVTYDDDGSVFLAKAAALAVSDMLFA